MTITKAQGRDFNYFQKLTVSWTTFGGGPGFNNANDGYTPDVFISFPTQGLILFNESSSGVIEYSFNGNTLHGQLDGTTGSLSKMLQFDNRVASLIWFRIASASAVVSVQAWATR